MITSLSSIAQIAHSVGLTFLPVLAVTPLANDSTISTVARIAMEIAELLARRNIDNHMIFLSRFGALAGARLHFGAHGHTT